MMNWLTVWQVLRVVLAFGSILLAVISMVAIWRLRGILNWKHSLRNELKELNNEAEIAGETRQKALEVVKDRCLKMWRASSPEIRELLEISSYVRSIAGCYHQGVEKPERCISIGRFMNAAQKLVHRLELILRRSGFQRLQRVRIRHIRQSYEWYERANQNLIVQYLSRHLKIIRRVLRLRLVILPDPFSLLAFFSNRLTTMTLTRCLLVDIYLFVGRMAVDAYDEEKQASNSSVGVRELEKTLEDLYSLKSLETDISDPQIRGIRDRLVGLSSMLTSSPGIEEWKEAMIQTAHVVARKHFPESVRPLEEAALGPLLARSRIWVKSLCEAETLPIVNRLYMIKVDSLTNMKSLTDHLLSKRFRSVIKKGWEIYGWMKWPLKGYRWIKSGSPAGVAVNLGWVFAKVGFVNFVCRRTFDLAYKELEIVYCQSKSFHPPTGMMVDQGYDTRR